MQQRKIGHNERGSRRLMVYGAIVPVKMTDRVGGKSRETRPTSEDKARSARKSVGRRGFSVSTSITTRARQ